MMSLSLKSLALVFSIISLAQLVRSKATGCPAFCACRNTKVKCNFSRSNRSDVSFLTRSFIKNLANNITELDLSGNHITGWEKGIFEGLDHLTKLNLSSNPLQKLTPDAFKGLKSLKILDLSHTELTELQNRTFASLQSLERLILLDSQIQSISKNSLDGLTSLSRLDLKSDFLTCDCHLKWFSSWLGTRDIQEDVLCGLPMELRGRRVNRLEPEILHCEWPLQLPNFQLIPSTDQVIFEGDSLPVKCQASFFDSSMNFSWLHNGGPIHQTAKDVRVVMSSEKSMKFATLELVDVDEGFSGNWTCYVESSYGYVSRSLKIVVVSKSVIYCPPSKTSDNRGSYGWPSSLAGAIKVLPCVIDHSEAARAYRACNRDGSWGEPDTSGCPYVSEVTRMLGETASLNLSLPDVTMDNVMKMFHSIGPQTSDGSTIHDHTEICFLAKILEQLAAHSKKFEKIAGEVVMGLVNLSMNVSPGVLLQAQLMDRCCSRILQALENTITNLLSLEASHLALTSRNVAIQGYKVNTKGVKGISCRSESIARNQTDNVSLACEEGASSEIFGGDHRLSSFFIPLSTLSVLPSFEDKRHNNHSDNEVFDGKEAEDVTTASSTAGALVVVVLLRDPRLFPTSRRAREELKADNRSVRSNIDAVGEVFGPVLLANIVSPGRSVALSPSIVMTIKNPAKKFTLTQVKWEPLPGGYGMWTKGDCHQENDAGEVLQISEYNNDDEDDDIEESRHSTARFSCQSLGAFSLILSPSRSPILARIWRGIREVGILVYVGCFVLFLASGVIVATYLLHWKRIEMSRKTRHSVVNLNLSLLLLVVVFASGVKTYRVHVVCQVASVFLHYFSISTQIWITIISFKLMHMLTERQSRRPRDVGEKKPRRASVAPEYLLGWGVSAILCGIGSAVDWEDRYAEENKICFLNKSAAILMFFLPSSLVVTINLVFFIKIACISRRRLPEGQVAAEEEEAAEDCRDSLESGSNSCSPSSEEEEEEDEGGHQTSSNDLLGRRGSLLRQEGSDVSDCFRETSGVPSERGGEEEEEEEEFHGFGSTYPASSQLCGSAATMLLYCASWTTGMLAVAENPPEVFGRGFDGSFFGMMFLALSLGLSAFMAVYFCFGRKDVRRAVYDKCFGPPTTKEEIRQPVGIEADKSNHSTCPGIQQHQKFSRTSPSATGCGGSEEMQGSFAAKLSVIVDGKSSVVFYDPRQNGAAKRYWEKVRKKRNDLEKSHGNNNFSNGGVDEAVRIETKGLKPFPSSREGSNPRQVYCQCQTCTSPVMGARQSTCPESQRPRHWQRLSQDAGTNGMKDDDNDDGGLAGNLAPFTVTCEIQHRNGAGFYETFASGERDKSNRKFNDCGKQELVVEYFDDGGKHLFRDRNCFAFVDNFECDFCKMENLRRVNGNNSTEHGRQRPDAFVGDHAVNYDEFCVDRCGCNRGVWLKK